jgi:hypothetical protein
MNLSCVSKESRWNSRFKNVISVLVKGLVSKIECINCFCSLRGLVRWTSEVVIFSCNIFPVSF